MKEYLVRITETRERTYTIDAESFEEATEIVKELYENQDLRLTTEDISDVEFD